MSAVTTHVLDAALGRPAAGVPVRLEFLVPAAHEGRTFVAGPHEDATVVESTGAENIGTENTGTATTSTQATGNTNTPNAGGPQLIAAGETDADGRVATLGPDRLQPGIYRLIFDTAVYFESTGQTGFYPTVSVTFTLNDPAQHYHVPVLLSPFAYSTYRGS